MKEEKGQAILESVCCIVFILMAVWFSTDCFHALFCRFDYQQYVDEYINSKSFEVGERHLHNMGEGVENVVLKAESRVEEKNTWLSEDLEYTTQYEVRTVELKAEIKRLMPFSLAALYKRLSGDISENNNIILTVKATGAVYDEENQEQ